jgi:hypothetical protein
MINNRKAGNRIDKMDFEKLKKRIAIHEFFTREWTELPEFSNSVGGFNSDQSIRDGYDIMYEKVEKKLEELQDAADADLNALYDKGENEFMKTMVKENMKGVNMMSKPAVYITKMLSAYQQEMTQKFNQEYAILANFIKKQREIKNRSGEDDKCADYDRRTNNYMRAVNPGIREFYQKHLEEFRTWLNAWCTWRWFLTGNIKNVVTSEYISRTRAFLDLHRQAVQELEYERPACVASKEDSPANIADLPVPSFLCPVVVTMPIGLEALRLSAEAATLDDNSFGIKQSGGTMPNATISFGVGKGTITEPGLYGTPYIKTANGSINQSGFNYADNRGDEFVPVSKIPPVDESTPLDPKLSDNNKKQKLTQQDVQKLQQAKLARQLLNKMMTADCSNKKKKYEFRIRLGSVEFEDEPQFTVEFGGVEFEDEPEGSGEAGINGIKDVETNGVQTTINNGLEALGTLKVTTRPTPYCPSDEQGPALHKNNFYARQDDRAEPEASDDRSLAPERTITKTVLPAK